MTEWAPGSAIPGPTPFSEGLLDSLPVVERFAIELITRWTNPNVVEHHDRDGRSSAHDFDLRFSNRTAGLEVTLHSDGHFHGTQGALSAWQPSTIPTESAWHAFIDPKRSLKRVHRDAADVGALLQRSEHGVTGELRMELRRRWGLSLFPEHPILGRHPGLHLSVDGRGGAFVEATHALVEAAERSLARKSASLARMQRDERWLAIVIMQSTVEAWLQLDRETRAEIGLDLDPVTRLFIVGPDGRGNGLLLDSAGDGFVARLRLSSFWSGGDQR